MNGTETFSHREILLTAADRLPTVPGVYIMMDKDGKVIYVGKSKCLKNRVSQYFQNSAKNRKTMQMVSHVDRFETILCSTETEALTLENALIKKHKPKYNILLKDSKSYPYFRIGDGAYPTVSVIRRRGGDKAKYYGPYPSGETVHTLLDIFHKELGLPTCKREFPRDIGKGRPCIYYEMGKCSGVCTGMVSSEDYKKTIRLCEQILDGDVMKAISILSERMTECAELEQFERAAKFRDAIRSLEKVKEKQQVVTSPDVSRDVFGFYFSPSENLTISVLHIRNGTLTGKEDREISGQCLSDSCSVSSFISTYYDGLSNLPDGILLSLRLEEEDEQSLCESLSSQKGKKISVSSPVRGEKKKLTDLALRNAREAYERSMQDREKTLSVLVRLGELLLLDAVPDRIESYDVSNFGKECKTVGMVVYVNGKPDKKSYRLFNIKDVEGVNDVSSMTEAILRRFDRVQKDENDEGFYSMPDLILLDGGREHVSPILDALRKVGVNVPVFGMVKDEYHKTRSLCSDNAEISIAGETDVYRFLFAVQEEVHRFSIRAMHRRKTSTVKKSTLEKIPGIGPQKAALILKALGGLTNVKNASAEELLRVRGITEKEAYAVYGAYHKPII